MASEIAGLEVELKAYNEQLDIVQSQLKGDPDNAELNSLRAELNEMITLLNESLSELKPKQAKPAPTTQQQQERAPRENQARKAAAAAAEDRDAGKDSIVTYQVNDTVMAKWVSGDKGFYPARITSITGSSTDPVYIVKFKSYDTTETLRAKDIRPASNKRKADGTPASSAPPQAAPSAAATNNGVVLSAAAKPYPDQQQQQAKRDAETGQALDSNGKPPKAKKIKANKELEAGKNKWQEFSAKSKFAKSSKKESMFRTPQGIRGRVGFTGSGQEMTKDQARTRHVYQANDELE